GGDGAGEPLRGATVRIGVEESTTDSRGVYELSVGPDDAQELPVDKPGYRNCNEDVSFEGVDEVIQDIDLAPQHMQDDQGFERIGEDPMLHDQRQDRMNDGSLQRDPNLQGQQGQQGGVRQASQGQSGGAQGQTGGSQGQTGGSQGGQ